VPISVVSSLSQLNILRFVIVHDIMNSIFTFQRAHFDTTSLIYLLIHVRIISSNEWTMIRGMFILSFLAVITTVLLSATHGYNGLSFKPTSSPDIFTFTILQIADIHLGEASNTDWGHEQDRETYAALNTFLSIIETPPDLIVLSGDQINCQPTSLIMPHCIL
jgi:hypothetical protein